MRGIKPSKSYHVALPRAAAWAVALSTATPGCANAAGELLTDDGAWCWFQDPRAVCVAGERSRTYAQWVTRNGHLQVGAFDHTTREIEVHTVREDWGRNDHNVGAFLVLPDNRLMIFYAQHNGPGIYCRTALHPEVISQWGKEVTIHESRRITYAHPVYLAEEDAIYVFWRGGNWKPVFAMSRDGATWSRPITLIRDEEADHRQIRPYLKVVSDGRSAIHFTFTDGHPRVQRRNSVYYVRYANGRFTRADGTPAGGMDTLPLQPHDTDRVYDGRATGVRAWVWDIALDEAGSPVIAFARFPDTTDHRYALARWTGAEWTETEITPAGRWFPQTPAGRREGEPHYSGGVALDPLDPSIVYLSRQVGGAFEIEQWLGPDEYGDWISRPVTQDSRHLNVRPVASRGCACDERHILWMFGAYRNYRVFRTGIRLMTVQDIGKDGVVMAPSF